MLRKFCALALTLLVLAILPGCPEEPYEETPAIDTDSPAIGTIDLTDVPPADVSDDAAATEALRRQHLEAEALEAKPEAPPEVESKAVNFPEEAASDGENDPIPEEK
jgi:hypothetical protein